MLRSMLTPFSVAAALITNGCAIGTPFREPAAPSNSDGAAQTETAHVVLTHAVLRPDRTLRSEFWKQVRIIHEVLPEQPGLVGYSLRRNLGGSEAWTMTVWTDANSSERFVAHETHVTAMRTAADALASFGSTRFDLPRKDIPISWSRAIELLDQQSSGYPGGRPP